VFGRFGWMGALVALLAAVGVVGYVLVLARCAEEERWAQAARGRRTPEDARRVRDAGDVQKRAA
jgi:hypothetical protein